MTPQHLSPARGKAIFEDIKRRLNKVIGALARATLEQAIADYRARDDATSGETIRRAMTQAAVRTGLVASGDPAVAIECLRVPASGGQFRPLAADETRALAFAVSPGYAALRRRLSSEVIP